MIAIGVPFAGPLDMGTETLTSGSIGSFCRLSYLAGTHPARLAAYVHRTLECTVIQKSIIICNSESCLILRLFVVKGQNL